jgi:hypothetical protein
MAIQCHTLNGIVAIGPFYIYLEAHDKIGQYAPAIRMLLWCRHRGSRLYQSIRHISPVVDAG